MCPKCMTASMCLCVKAQLHWWLVLRCMCVGPIVGCIAGWLLSCALTAYCATCAGAKSHMEMPNHCCSHQTTVGRSATFTCRLASWCILTTGMDNGVYLIPCPIAATVKECVEVTCTIAACLLGDTIRRDSAVCHGHCTCTHMWLHL